MGVTVFTPVHMYLLHEKKNDLPGGGDFGRMKVPIWWIIMDN